MKNKKIIKLVISIMLGLSVMSTGVSATNEISGATTANGNIPLTITTTGLTIKATLPVSLDMSLTSDSLEPTQTVTTSNFTIVNNTTTGGGVAIPIKVSYGLIDDTADDVTIKNAGSDVTSDVTVPSKEIALSILKNGTENALSPSKTLDSFIDTLSTTNTYSIKLYSSPAFKYGITNFSVRVPFKISLY